VRYGLLVVTRSDLADPAPALARAGEELSRTSLAGIPAVVCSGRTGAGLGDLRPALASVLHDVPPPDPAADVRLWVDREFHVRGTGTVVTGTLPAGTLRVGDRLLLGDRPVRVRGLECLGEQVTQASGVARVAVALAERPADPGRALVTPDAYDAVEAVDVRVTGGRPLPERPLLHVGATFLSVHARPLGDRFARLRLEHPLPLRVGDRALLRDPGDRSLWGIEVLDVDPPTLRRRASAARRAAVLETLDGTLAADLAARGLVRRTSLRRRGIPSAPVPGDALVHGDWIVSGVYLAQSGAPLSVTIGSDVPGVGNDFIGAASSAPNLSRASVTGTSSPNLSASERTIARWFNTGAFLTTAQMTPGQWGNSGRAILIGPGFTSVDVSLFKDFKIRESKALQFRAESFNLPNHPSWTAVGTTVGTSTFGSVTGASVGRVLQFGMKLSF